MCTCFYAFLVDWGIWGAAIGPLIAGILSCRYYKLMKKRRSVGSDLGETCGNIIAQSYKLMVEIKPDAVLVLGDTNSCLSVIGAKRLHIPIFHMEAGNRCKDECLPEETNRRIVDIISDVNMACGCD